MEARLGEEGCCAGRHSACRELAEDVRKHEHATYDPEDIEAVGQVEVFGVDAKITSSGPHGENPFLNDRPDSCACSRRARCARSKTRQESRQGAGTRDGIGMVVKKAALSSGLSCRN